MHARLKPLLLVVALAGCGDAVLTGASPGERCDPPAELASDGSCRTPDTERVGCAPGEADFEGNCVPAGVPASACGPYFEPDGERGCRAVLPPVGACPDGQMALPGEGACRPLMPCGDAPFGDLPTGALVQHVWADYAGGDSDGTAERPWTELAAAVAAVEAGGTIAIGPGVYEGDTVVIDRPGVSVRGLCPQQVEIRGPVDDDALRLQADGVTLAGVSVTGHRGVNAYGDGIRVERTWIHDTTSFGARAGSGPGEVQTWSRVLVERSADAGVLTSGEGGVRIEDAVVRSSVEGELGISDGITGLGLRLELALKRVLIEDTLGFGLRFSANHLEAEGLVIRAVRPLDHDQLLTGGACLQVRQASTGNDQFVPLTTTELRQVVMEGCPGRGVNYVGGEHRLELATVTHIAPPDDYELRGEGLVASQDLESGANVEVRFSTVRHAERSNVSVAGSRVDLFGVYLAPTDAADITYQAAGLVAHPAGGQRCYVTLRGSRVEGGVGGGVKLLGSDARIARTVIADSRSGLEAPHGGHGVIIGEHQLGAGDVALVDARIETSQGLGLVSVGGRVELTRTEIAGVSLDPAGQFGQGLVFVGGTAALDEVLVRDTAATSLVAVDGAVLSIGESEMCASPALRASDDVDISVPEPNRCGCGMEPSSCDAYALSELLPEELFPEH